MHLLLRYKIPIIPNCVLANEFSSDITSKSSFQMHYKLKFDLKLRWIDNRLDYRNLNEDPFKNVVPTPMVQKMWKPPIRFENTQKRPLLEFDPSFSTVTLSRKGIGEAAPHSHLHEARIYNSSETEILAVTFQFLKLICNFDLMYFPFDQHECPLRVNLSFGSRPRNTILNF